MKILGYILKGLSMFLMLILLINMFSIFNKFMNHKNENLIYFLGYIFGTIVGYVGIIWASVSLYKYSKKLIYKSKTNKEITNIGNE